MNKMYRWLGSFGALLLFMLLDGFVYYSAYYLGFQPFVNEFNMDLPDIKYNIFVLFAGMMHIFKGSTGETYDINEHVGWGRIISSYLSKCFVIFVLFLMHLFLIFLI